MENVYYFSGYRLTLYELNGKRIAQTKEFVSTDEGYAAFKGHLEEIKPTTSYLVVDIVEEDLHFESVPKLSPAKLDAYVNRLKNKLFRNNPPICYKLVRSAPENSARRILRLSTLSNPELIRRWIDPMLEAKVPLAGIYSAPLLAGHLPEKIRTKSKKLLLITQHIESAIRYTFIEANEMQFTRSAKIEYKHIDAKDYGAICEQITTDIENISAYLYNQKLLDYDAHLDVIAVLSTPIATQLQLHGQNYSELDIHCYPVESLLASLKYISQDCLYASAVIACCVPTTFTSTDHYATDSDKRFYTTKRFGLGLYATGTLSVIASIAVSALIMMDALNLRAEADSIATQANDFEIKYYDQFSDDEKASTIGHVMRDSVNLYNELEQYSKITPIQSLIGVSQVLNNPRYNSINIKGYKWALLDSDKRSELGIEEKEEEDNSYDMMGSMDQYDADGNWIETPEEQTVAAVEVQNKVIEYIAVIQGDIIILQGQYRQTVDTMRSFIENLEAIELITKLDIIKLPVDIRSSSNYSDSRSHDEEKMSVENRTGGFEIRIFMEHTIHAQTS